MADDDFVKIAGESVAGETDIQDLEARIEDLERRMDELEEALRE